MLYGFTATFGMCSMNFDFFGERKFTPDILP